MYPNIYNDNSAMANIVTHNEAFASKAIAKLRNGDTAACSDSNNKKINWVISGL